MTCGSSSEKREREREQYIEGQKNRIAKMMKHGGAAIEETEQRVVNDNARAERLAAEQEHLDQARDAEKARKRSQLHREMQDELDAQMAAKKAEKKAAKQADRDLARSEQEKVRKLNEADAQKQAKRRQVEVETQAHVLGQIRESYGVTPMPDSLTPSPPSVGRSSRASKAPSPQKQASFKNGRQSRQLKQVDAAIRRTQSKLEAGGANDTFMRPPPGLRPQRN